MPVVLASLIHFMLQSLYCFVVQDWSLVAWIALIVTGVALATTRASRLVIKSFFVSAFFKLVILFGTHKMLMLLGACMVSIW